MALVLRPARLFIRWAGRFFLGACLVAAAPPDARKLNDAGMELYRAGRFVEAAAKFDAAAAADPGYFLARMNAAAAAARADRSEGASQGQGLGRAELQALAGRRLRAQQRVREAFALDPRRTASKLMTDADFVGALNDLVLDDDLREAVEREVVVQRRRRAPWRFDAVGLLLQVPGDWAPRRPCQAKRAAGTACAGPRYIEPGDVGGPWPLEARVVSWGPNRYQRMKPHDALEQPVNVKVAKAEVGGRAAVRLDYALHGIEGALTKVTELEVPAPDGSTCVITLSYTVATMGAGIDAAATDAEERNLLEEVLASAKWE